MIPYPYQLPHPQHLSAVAQPPAPIQVPDTSVFSYSQGETGSHGAIGGLISTTTARPLISQQPVHIPAPYAPAQNPYLPRPTIRYGQRYTSTGLGLGNGANQQNSNTKYITSIEPQLILGPFSLPPQLQNFPHTGGYNYAPPPRPAFNFEQQNHHFGSFLSNRRPLLDTFTAPASLKVRPLTHNFIDNHSTGFGSYAAPSQHVYNTIAYSVPMGPHKLKRDSGKSTN